MRTDSDPNALLPGASQGRRRTVAEPRTGRPELQMESAFTYRHHVNGYVFCTNNPLTPSSDCLTRGDRVPETGALGTRA